MWELDHKEGWMLKNRCFPTVVLEKTLESLSDCKIKPVNPKWNQPWVFIGRTDAEAEAPILWPSDAKSWLIRKDPDAGKDWRQQEKGMIEEEMVGRHHQVRGYEFEQALGDGERQGSLVCCSPGDCKDSDMSEQLNNNQDQRWVRGQKSEDQELLGDPFQVAGIQTFKGPGIKRMPFSFIAPMST